MDQFQSAIGVDFRHRDVNREINWDKIIIPDAFQETLVSILEDITVDEILTQTLQQLQDKLPVSTNVTNLMSRLQHYLS